MDQLASNHHSSDYNRAKFGRNGSAVQYLPLSLHFPEKFDLLLERQRLSEKHQAWWPAAQENLDLKPEIISTSLSSPTLIKTSFTHPINISFVIPTELKAIISSHALLAPLNSPTILEIPPNFNLLHLSPIRTISPTNAQLTAPAFQTRLALATSIKAAIAACIQALPSPNDIQVRTSSLPPLAIGNLYLSSCPGKKVRLDGPVNGRSSVCRDLEADMARMRHLGVSCIVCCLDDDELDFLGAPWQKYAHCANKIGIDVLRLPTPEGLPPATSASHLDGHLVDLIHRYSLRGESILVHCRGGVGRAGVMACCWMIRLGLCGWLSEKDGNTTDSSTISFVKAVIDLIRRRRSMKAIETYEQVKFLVEYVEHLRSLEA